MRAKCAFTISIASPPDTPDHLPPLPQAEGIHVRAGLAPGDVFFHSVTDYCRARPVFRFDEPREFVDLRICDVHQDLTHAHVDFVYVSYITFSREALWGNPMTYPSRRSPQFQIASCVGLQFHTAPGRYGSELRS